MSEQTPQPRAPMRRGLRIVLVASLAVNMIVAGLAVGAVLGNKNDGGKVPRDGDFMGAFSRALPEEDRRSIGRAIRDHHKKSGINREAARAEFQAMLLIIRTVPFDADAMKEHVSSQAQSSFERRVAAQEIWLQRVAAMSDAERQDYADQIEAVLSRQSGGKKKRDE